MMDPDLLLDRPAAPAPPERAQLYYAVFVNGVAMSLHLFAPEAEAALKARAVETGAGGRIVSVALPADLVEWVRASAKCYCGLTLKQDARAHQKGEPLRV